MHVCLSCARHKKNNLKKNFFLKNPKKNPKKKSNKNIFNQCSFFLVNCKFVNSISFLELCIFCIRHIFDFFGQVYI